MFDSDLSLSIGLLVLVFAIPSMVSAFSDNRPPRSAAIALLVGGGLVLLALTTRPGGYSFDEIPHAVMGVMARLMGR